MLLYNKRPRRLRKHMVKATLISMVIAVLFIVVYAVDLFAILSTNIVFCIATLLVVVTLIAAGIILGNPLINDESYDEDDK